MAEVIMAQYDILIVGGGMVGSALACCIAKTELGRALRIAVIEAQAMDLLNEPLFSGTIFDSRVSAISLASQQLLESIGAWPAQSERQQQQPELQQQEQQAQHQQLRVCPYREMKVWDAEGTGAIEFSAAEIGQPCLGHIVENSAITQALRQALAQHANIALIYPHKVVSMGLHEELQQQKIILEDGQELTAPLVVAADGALSMIRDLAGFDMREWDYHHSAIVATVKTELPHQFTAWQRFMPEGPVAFLPLLTAEDGDDHYCSIVWSAQTHYAENLMSFSDEVFAAALGAAFELRLGKIINVSKRFSFPLRQRHAKTYFKPGVTLIGDAAHTIHPLAGQGVNLGFADVDALAAEIQRALQRKIPLGHESILMRYQRQRMGKNLATMGVMEGFKRLFAQTALPVRWIRNEGMRQINHLGFVKRQIIKQAMGI